MVIIDGAQYNIPVVSLTRTADFLDKYADRTEDGQLHRELIGVYYNYKLDLGTTLNTAEYARLWDKLTEPAEFHTVTVPAENGDYTFTAYFSSVGDKMLRKWEGNNYFTGLSVSFTAKHAARK